MANETLAPDAILQQFSLSGTLGTVDEDPASNDGSWLTAPNNSGTSCRVSFPTPSGSLNGTQTFRIRLRKTSTNNGRTDDTWTVTLYENGSSVAEIGSGGNIPTDPGQVISVNWDASLISDATAVECEVTGTPELGGNPNNRGSVEVGAFAWDVEYQVGGESLSSSTSIGVGVSSSSLAIKDGSTTSGLTLEVDNLFSTTKTGAAGVDYTIEAFIDGDTTTVEQYSTSTSIALLTSSTVNATKAAKTDSVIDLEFVSPIDAAKAAKVESAISFQLQDVLTDEKQGISDGLMGFALFSINEATKDGQSAMPVSLEIYPVNDASKNSVVDADISSDFTLSSFSSGFEQYSTSTEIGVALSSLGSVFKSGISTTTSGYSLQINFDVLALKTVFEQRSSAVTVFLDVDIDGAASKQGTIGITALPIKIDPKSVKLWPHQQPLYITGKAVAVSMSPVVIKRHIAAINEEM